MRALRIQLRRLLQRFHGLLHASGRVQADAEIPPCQCRVRGVELRALGVGSLGLFDLSCACQHVPQIVVVAGIVRLGGDRLLIGVDRLVVASGQVVSFAHPRPEQVNVRVLLRCRFLRFLELSNRLACKVGHLGLCRVPLVRWSL